MVCTTDSHKKNRIAFGPERAFRTSGSSKIVNPRTLPRKHHTRQHQLTTSVNRVMGSGAEERNVDQVLDCKIKCGEKY
jgi:hypothetical protein